MNKKYLPEKISWFRLPEYVQSNRDRITTLENFGGGGGSDYVSNVVLNGTDLEFTGTGLAFNTSVDLSSLGGGSATGLEAIDEGNGTGWRLVGKDPANYGNIGENAVDFTVNNNPNNTDGATGIYSFAAGLSTRATSQASVAFGLSTTSSGNASFAAGVTNTASGNYSTAFGTGSTASGNSSFAHNGQSTGFRAFTSNGQALGDYSQAIGSEAKAFSGKEIALGFNNTTYTPSSTSTFELSDRILSVGIGGTPGSTSAGTEKDALIILKNGTITAPSLTPSLITTAGNFSLITKEYADANYSNTDLILTSSTIVTSRTNETSPGVTSDINGIANCTSDTPITITLVEESIVPVEIGRVALYKRSGDGNVTVVAGNNVIAPTYQTYREGEILAYRKIAANTWECLNPPIEVVDSTLNSNKILKSVANNYTIISTDGDLNTYLVYEGTTDINIIIPNDINLGINENIKIKTLALGLGKIGFIYENGVTGENVRTETTINPNNRICNVVRNGANNWIGVEGIEFFTPPTPLDLDSLYVKMTPESIDATVEDAEITTWTDLKNGYNAVGTTNKPQLHLENGEKQVEFISANGDFLAIPDANTNFVPGTDEFTISIKIGENYTNQDQILYAKGGLSTASRQLAFFMLGGAFRVHVGGVNLGFTSGTISAGDVLTLVVRVDGADLYQNNTLIYNNVAIGSSTFAADFIIGANYQGAHNNSDASFSYFLIYDEALTATEVNNITNFLNS